MGLGGSLNSQDLLIHTRPVVITVLRHVWKRRFQTCPSVPTFQNQAKQNRYAGCVCPGLGDHWWPCLVSNYSHLKFADSQLTRKAPASYADGVYTMNGHGRPSPRTLSQAFMKGADGLKSIKNRTALLTFFGESFCCSLLYVFMQFHALLCSKGKF